MHLNFQNSLVLFRLYPLLKTKMKNLSIKLLVIFISFLIFLFFLSRLEYQNFTYQLLDFYTKTDRIIFFRQNLLTETRFAILKLTFLGFYILFSALFIWKGKTLKTYLFIAKNRISMEVKSIFKKIKSTWNQILVVEKIALFIPLLIYIAFWWVYGWQNDEVFSYTFFVDRGILVCATYYPGPNNHVAFLIFSAMLDKLIPSFFSDFICLKLPATLAAILSLWIIWLFFYQKKQKIVAWFSFVLIAFHWGFFFYGTHGRGYAWIILFFLGSSFAVFKLISNQTNYYDNLKTVGYSNYWFLWAVSLILGCYTIPIFIYVWFGSLLGLWSIGNNKIRKESIVVSFFSGIIILILYSPILIFNGLSAIISNSWVAPLSFEKWLNEFPLYLWNVHGNTGILAFVASLLLFFYKKEYRKISIYFWCIAYSPYLIAFIQKVLPFERVFLYRQIAEIFTLIFCIEILFKKYLLLFIYKNKIILYLFVFLAVLYAAFMMYSEHKRYNIQTNVYQFAEPLAKKIYRQKPSSILVLEDTYNLFLRYYFRDSDTKVEVLPSPHTNYQIIILPKDKKIPLPQTDSLNYSVFYEDAFVVAYSLE